MNQAILLVEDDGSLNRGISLKLEKEGYTVCRAETLREARRLYQEGDFALIICDIACRTAAALTFAVRSAGTAG